MIKLPEPKIPTKEQMTAYAEEWWKRFDGIKLSDYNSILVDNTIPFQSFYIPKDLVIRTLNSGDTGWLAEDIVREYEQILPTLKEGDLFFGRLNTRSPKDVSELRFTSVAMFIDAIVSSMRCFEDMCMLYYIDKAEIIIRPFIDIPKRNEWRILVKDSNIVGISQYFYQESFGYTDDEAQILKSKIEKFVNTVVMMNLRAKSFVVDLIVNTEDAPVIIETNPFGSSDPCLFESYDKLNGDFLYVKA